MKIRYIINLHKGLTFFWVLGLMFLYQNFSLAPWVYLSLHGTYGLLWLLKDRIYPDRQWDQVIPLWLSPIAFFILGLYWVAPFLLISNNVEITSPLVALAIAINIIGIFLHYSSDAQKYFTLKYRPGLITEGFFARCRNTNYLGEIFIYTSFALLAQHWLPFAILSFFAVIVFVPNMRKKDNSLSRYPDFEEYKANSGLLLPQLFPLNISNTQTTNNRQTN